MAENLRREDFREECKRGWVDSMRKSSCRERVVSQCSEKRRGVMRVVLSHAVSIEI